MWRQPRLLVALGMFLFICTFSINFNVLLPLVASDTLGAGAEVYGLLTACFGAGALVGALISASLGKATWPILLASAAGFGFGEVLLAPETTIFGAAVILILVRRRLHPLHLEYEHDSATVGTGLLAGARCGPLQLHILQQQRSRGAGRGRAGEPWWHATGVLRRGRCSAGVRARGGCASATRGNCRASSQGERSWWRPLAVVC